MYQSEDGDKSDQFKPNKKDLKKLDDVDIKVNDNSIGGDRKSWI